MSSVTGQDNVIRVMLAVRDGVRPKMLELMPQIGFDIQQYVQAEKLSGQVLNRRTGRLRNSINSRVSEDASSVSAQVGTGVVYARPHEYGFQGTVSVPAHQRMQTMAFGRSIAARMVEVRSHPMRMNLPEKSFLRSSLADKGPEEIGRIRAAMNELLVEARA